MPVPRLAKFAVVAVMLPACTTNPVDPPPQLRLPPLVEFDTRIRADTVTLTSAVTVGEETITDHRLFLNGVLIRSGPVTSWTVKDTILVSGTYSFSAEATSSGGRVTRAFEFLVREILPPTARDAAFEGEEAGSISVNMTTVTAGAIDRQYTFDPPAAVVIERTGASTIRVRATANGTTPADDVHGSFEVPYTVTDQRGSASGVLQFNFRPQPDITITAMRFLTGESVGDTVRITLNGQTHNFTVGTRVQGRAGQNIWAMPGQSPHASLVGLIVDGQGAEVPLNGNLSETMTLGSFDLGAELVVLGTTYPGFDAACRASFESVYRGVHADTVKTMEFVVRTTAGPGREAIEIGGESYLRWREAFDSLVAEEGRRAVQMDREPRTFIFTNDIETVMRYHFTGPFSTGQPAAGQLWITDSIPAHLAGQSLSGGRTYTAFAGDVVSGAAWSSPLAPAPNRRMALAKWFDGWPAAPAVSACSRHRGTFGPEVANPVPHPMEATLLPLLQARANWSLLNRGRGLLILE